VPRRYLFTLNNPTELELNQMMLFVNTNDQFRFLVFQGEYAETGTPHLQGYLEIQKNQRMSWFKSNFSERAHFEVANGTSEQNIHYCTKPVVHPNGIPCMCKHCLKNRESLSNWRPAESHGTPASDIVGNGMWESVQIMVSGGATDKEITDMLPTMIGNLSKLRDYRHMLKCEQMANPTCKSPEFQWRPIRAIWITGLSGSGKSQAVRTAFPLAYPVSEEHPFDEYANQQVVLWDDFDPRRIKFKTLLRYLDKYPVQLDCRYRAKWACYNDFFFTHTGTLASVYPDLDPKDFVQLSRRINVVQLFVICTKCGAQAKFYNGIPKCPFHQKNSHLTREFRWNKQKFYTMQALLDVIPYRYE
jgi:hypothetical protein